MFIFGLTSNNEAIDFFLFILLAISLKYTGVKQGSLGLEILLMSV